MTGAPRRWLVPVVLLLLAGAFLAWRLSARAAVRVTNGLVLPVRVRIDAGLDTTLAPGSSVIWRLGRGTVSALEWELVRPRTRGGLPVGEPLSGSRILSGTDRRVEHVIRARQGERAFFAPLITNETGAPLQIRVNAGLAGALDCPCAIPAGARRAPVGYYPLFRNSTVEARNAEGLSGTFRDLGGEPDARSGAVGLRFGPADLR
jgi:hypothetical protein